jgi:2-aminoethylphosphonate-pyruvate transaminase
MSRTRLLAPRTQVLFNPGPVNLDPAIKARLFDVELSHRQPEFEELASRVRASLLALAGAQAASHRLGLLHGSGGLAVDAALSTLVRGTVLVLNNGIYCERIADTLRTLEGATVVEHRPGVGIAPDLDELDTELERTKPDWVAVVHHETTTGLLNPIAAISALARRHEARVFVDAVSSFGAHHVDPEADVVCFNSNKCLESLPGIAAVLWRAELETFPTVPVLDVARYADAIPYTPHVQAFIALDIALDLLASEDRPARYERLARAVWAAGGGAGFEPFLPETARSHVLTSFLLAGRDPDSLFERALENGYVIYHGQRELRSTIFRVANMGAAIDEATIQHLFEVLAAP